MRRMLLLVGITLVSLMMISLAEAHQTCEECMQECYVEYTACSNFCIELGASVPGCEESCQNQEWSCIQSCWYQYTWWCE
jgi:hypothetical protein